MAAMVRIAGRPERRELADQSLGVRNIKSGIAKNGNILSGKVRFSLIAVCRRSLQLSCPYGSSWIVNVFAPSGISM